MKKLRKAKLGLFLAAVSVLFFSCDKNIALPPAELYECWSYPRGDAGNTAFADEKISPNLKILWQAETDALDPSSPTVYGGVVFVGLPNKKFVGYGAETGQKCADVWTDVPMKYPPIAGDGKLFYIGFGGWNRVGVYDITAGKKLWSRSCGNSECFPIVCDTTMVIFTLSGGVYGLRISDGEKLWALRVKPGIMVPPATDGRRIFFAAGDKIYCITAEGKILWKVGIGKPIVGTLTLAGGRILAPTDDKIFSISADSGQILGGFAACKNPAGAIATDGNIIICAERTGKVGAVSLKSGAPLWSVPLGDVIVAPPIVVGDFVVACTYSGKIFLVDKNSGRIANNTAVDGRISRPPAYCRGKIFVSTQDGKMFCIRL